jgi:hypothetical protein
MVQLQLMSGEPMQEIVDLLQYVRDDLNNQQKMADELNVT